jgi:NADH-quinone oxidoreductase subunit G
MMDGGNLDDAFDLIHSNAADVLVILENDLYRRLSENTVTKALENCRRTIVLDHLMNATVEKADIVLPVAAYAESSGTMVNNEGRAQRFTR